jgi:5-methylcytosine-specific restriction endonuclease McrA
MKKAELKNLYINRGLTKSQIAERYGYSESKVKYLLEKYEIKKNDKNPITDVTPKKCTQCGEEKPSTEFYIKSDKGKKTIGSACKVCASGKTVARYKSYKLGYLALKGGCCQACGFDRYEGALEFHHIDPATKDDAIAKMMRHPSSPKILAELEKCILVCSNCHRMIHAEIIECPKLN